MSLLIPVIFLYFLHILFGRLFMLYASAFGGQLKWIFHKIFSSTIIPSLQLKGCTCLRTMPLDTDQWCAEIENFNGFLHYFLHYLLYMNLLKLDMLFG